MATSSQQAHSPGAQHHQENMPEQPTVPATSFSTAVFSTTYAKVVIYVITSAFYHVVAGRTQSAICSSQPWWLRDAAGTIIRTHGADIVNKLEITGGRRLLLHAAAFGLGLAMDRIISKIYGRV